MNVYTQIQPFNADIYTPVELYLSVRNDFRKACLLESNDYHSRQDSKSFIGFDPIVELECNGSEITVSIDGEKRTESINKENISSRIQSLLDYFSFKHQPYNGFFGRMSFEMNVTDETHIERVSSDLDIPQVHLFIFRYIVVIDHFSNDGYLLENSLQDSFTDVRIEDLFKRNRTSQLPFETIGDQEAEFTDEEFEELVKKGIQHCERGDVFQLVLSNHFQQAFFGDDFQVYRQLRRLNPSPYLFYFDFESYRLFGSSPEAQLLIKKGIAEIHPIAGTVPKTGIEEEDRKQLAFLLADEKENAEHTMLVDLARNDLSRDCDKVTVSEYKEVQHFSHVTHLVSKVTGEVNHKRSFEALSHSFPAGTLSGTPKPRALELINQYERSSRDFYGGAIGIIGTNGDLNTAIVIRSILSKNNRLHYRAGAGIVLDSDPKRETQEVHHKLRALRKAIELTETLFKQHQTI